MATVCQVKTTWTGLSGGVGLTILHIATDLNGVPSPTQVQSMVNRVRTFFDAIKAQIPDEVQLEVSPEVDEFDVASGTLTGSQTAATAPTVVACTGSAVYGAGTGFRVDWTTGKIVRGRRLRGRTFIVPAVSSVYDASGGMSTTVQTSVNTAAAALISGLQTDTNRLSIWARPNAEKGYAGALENVVSGSVANKSAVYRPRRD